jgi:hypothetical protein
MRFIAGTHYTAAQLAKSVARGARRGKGSAHLPSERVASSSELSTTRSDERF